MKNNNQNYYDILEVNSTSSPTVIRAAYKALMQKYHPDKNTSYEINTELENKILSIREAFDVLSNDSRRREYDELIFRNDKSSNNNQDISRYSEIESDLISDANARNKPSNSTLYLIVLLLIIFIFTVGYVVLIERTESDISQNLALEQTATQTYITSIKPPEPEVTENKELRTIHNFAKNIRVKLPPSEDGYSYCKQSIGVICKYSIVIPEVTLLIYTKDSEVTINHLKSNSDLFIKRVNHELSKELYTTYASVDGSEKLSQFIKNTINNIAVGNAYKASFEEKGVENVFFPKSFKIINN